MTDNKEEQKSDWKERELGALWRREGKQQNFLSGMIRIGDPLGADSVKEIKVVVFTNKGKAKNERAPDFIVYEDRPRDIPSDAGGNSQGSHGVRMRFQLDFNERRVCDMGLVTSSALPSRDCCQRVNITQSSIRHSG